jgi:trigger factor
MLHTSAAPAAALLLSGNPLADASQHHPLPLLGQIGSCYNLRKKKEAPPLPVGRPPTPCGRNCVKITVETTPNSEAVLDVEFEWVEVEKASDRAYRKLVQKYTVPGFRRGHAPRTMLERMIGKDAIYQEGVDDLINESYKRALADHHLTPIGEADVDAQPVEPGQPYHFKATVPILSPVVLGDYRSIHVDQPDITVSDDDVDRVLADYQRQQAVWVPVERPAELGDRVTVNLLLQVGEKTISDLKDHEFELVQERTGLFTGLDDQLVGTSEGDTKSFTLTIPEDYLNKDLAGKEAEYTITVQAVKHQELPELDDELAKGAGKYETMAELRQSIHSQLLRNRISQGQQDMENQILDAALEQATIQVHHLMVEDEADHLYDRMGRMLAQQGLNMEQYLKISQKTPEEYKQELEPEATRHVKIDLLLEAIADQEGLTPNDAELQELLNLYNQAGLTKIARISQVPSSLRKRMEGSLKRDKARKFLIDHATRALEPQSDLAEPETDQPSAPTEADEPAAETSQASS